MKKLMLALDRSPHSRRAAQYAAEIVPHLPGAVVVLFSVLRGVPYGGAESNIGAPAAAPEVHGNPDHSQEVLEIHAFLDEVASHLRRQGVPSERLQVVIKPLRRGIAHDVLDEAAKLACDTIVIGRRGLSRVGELIQGSTSREIVQKASGQAVWVIQ